MQSDQPNKVRLSTIYNRYFDSYVKDPKLPVTKEAFKAVNQTIACRTSRIGTLVYKCPDCEETKYVLRSCKNRFCPRCGYADTKAWANKMLDKIAPCSHHHIVFTIAAPLRQIGISNKDMFHSLLLKSAAETMIDWFNAKYKLLPGIMNVLHTAGSDQKYHPHVHMICSAGGLNKENKLIPIKQNGYLINQVFLAKKFRWHFEKGLFKLFKSGDLKTSFKDIIEFKQFISEVNKQDWVVSVQAPLKKADDIVNYVGRYTKRACISEYNIISADNDEIKFRHKDYKHTDHSGKPQMAQTTLHYRDFLARLFQHVPSKGFRMVRYYGMYSNRKISQDKVVEEKKSKDKATVLNWRDYQILKTGIDPLVCPCCNKEMILVNEHYDNRTRWVRDIHKDWIPEHWSAAV
jgi:hypothetical protein